VLPHEICPVDGVVIDGHSDMNEAYLTGAASLEQYSKHPLTSAIVVEAKRSGIATLPVDHISERPGENLRGTIAGHSVCITGRNKEAAQVLPLPPPESGLECLVFLDDKYAAANSLSRRAAQGHGLLH